MEFGGVMRAMEATEAVGSGSDEDEPEFSVVTGGYVSKRSNAKPSVSSDGGGAGGSSQSIVPAASGTLSLRCVAVPLLPLRPRTRL